MSDKNQTFGSFVEVENELKMLANGLGISSPHSGMFPLVRSQWRTANPGAVLRDARPRGGL